MGGFVHHVVEHAVISFTASETHFADHLLQVYRALPSDVLGGFYTTDRATAERARDSGVEARPGRPPHGELTVVSSWGDLEKNRGNPVILFEHGVGQTYADQAFKNFAGGPGRDNVVAFACPNKAVQKANARAYRGVPSAVVGLPRLWPWHRKKRGRTRHRKFPMVPGDAVVAVSFHWDSMLCPETRTAFPYYREAVRRLARDHEVIGHGHPRIFDDLEPLYREMGVEPVDDFHQVLDRADVYACDNSSTLYEFASTDRPVVVLNQPSYRRHVEHGLRFWSHAHVGLHCDHPADLASRIELALDDLPEVAAVRREIVDEVVPCRGDMTPALLLLRDVSEGRLTHPDPERASRNEMIECSCGQTMRRALLVVHKRQKGCE